MKITVPQFRSRSLLILLVVMLVSILVVASPELAGAEEQVAAVHFTSCAFNTGNNATVLVPTDVSINGLVQLENGDEIAVFTPDGVLCAGVNIWTGSGNLAIAAWGDNDQTPAVDGLGDERMQFRIWDQSTDQEYIVNRATFTQGDGYYVADSTHVVVSMTSSNDLIYVSTAGNGYINGVMYLDEDIIAINLATGMVLKYIDFSDVSLTGDIDALLVLDDGDVLFSLQLPATLPDVGAVGDADIIRFTPTATGEVTAGAFSWYFDGSDVGLDTSGEDIDAFALAPDGRLLISTVTSGSVPGIAETVKDEDLIAFTASSLGEATAGTWEMYFDTSDTEFPGTDTDTDAAWVDGTSNDVFFSTYGTFSTASVSGDKSDAVRCVLGSLGSPTSCSSLSVVLDASTYGFINRNIDGLSFSTAPQPDIPFVSVAGNPLIDNIRYLDEDIIGYDGRLDQWYIYIDFSDVSLASDIDAFLMIPGGDILFSIQTPATLPDVGAVGDSDIIRFRPTSAGKVTSGTFSWYFDGSDVGLDISGEDIDAFALTPDGRLLVSIVTSGSVPGIAETVKDEDLIAFTPTTLGEDTAGTWEMYFDTSDTEFPGTATDVDSAWVDAVTDDVYFGTYGAFSTASVSGDQSDVVRCELGTLGSPTSCSTLSLYFDGSALRLAGQNVDGFSLVRDLGDGASVMKAPDYTKGNLILPDDFEDGDDLSALRLPKFVTEDLVDEDVDLSETRRRK